MAADLSWTSLLDSVSKHVHFRRPAAHESSTYNVLQRLTYLAVIFVMFPLMIWTGLAMSPAMTSVFPPLVTTLGGQQSARTIHFFDASLLVGLTLVHIGMVCLGGFRDRVGAMITGRNAAVTEHA